jgi:hypothetical protein
LEEPSVDSPIFIDKLIIVMGQEGALDLRTINITGDTRGILNIGEMHHVESIDVHVTALDSAGQADLARALVTVTEAVAASTELTPSVRGETLDQLSSLSEEAEGVQAGQARPGVARALLGALAGTLSAAGSLAEVWSTWGPTIHEFFAPLLGAR